ncbi:hypothetical protein [Scopulibacillus cellulosilyticus]|uniref:Double zinc ribbon protein n=1 Tax=Scopulibacillus cellulosilyticus TaxID=2665665 RepID=A0ABW2PRL0_9BACL
MANNDEYKSCVRCGNVCNAKDRYCIKCGAPLVNRCSDEPGLVSKGCRYVNDPEAAYCARCGEETLFSKHGIVTPYLSSPSGQGASIQTR